MLKCWQHLWCLRSNVVLEGREWERERERGGVGREGSKNSLLSPFLNQITDVWSKTWLAWAPGLVTLALFWQEASDTVTLAWRGKKKSCLILIERPLWCCPPTPPLAPALPESKRKSLMFISFTLLILQSHWFQVHFTFLSLVQSDVTWEWSAFYFESPFSSSLHIHCDFMTLD